MPFNNLNTHKTENAINCLIFILPYDPGTGTREERTPHVTPRAATRPACLWLLALSPDAFWLAWQKPPLVTCRVVLGVQEERGRRNLC